MMIRKEDMVLEEITLAHHSEIRKRRKIRFNQRRAAEFDGYARIVKPLEFNDYIDLCRHAMEPESRVRRVSYMRHEDFRWSKDRRFNPFKLEQKFKCIASDARNDRIKVLTLKFRGYSTDEETDFEVRDGMVISVSTTIPRHALDQYSWNRTHQDRDYVSALWDPIPTSGVRQPRLLSHLRRDRWQQQSSFQGPQQSYRRR
jgi:hypothetical protein